MKKTDSNVLDRAKVWLTSTFDEETQARVRNMIENEPDALVDAFYKDLAFGTGGLRGVMGVGTNRMNKYTVGMATQGLADYLWRTFSGNDAIRVAIAYDCRNNSRYFCDIAAEILSANGIDVFVFDALRPTPLLSFAVRELSCKAGIVITASHNPPEYNGYKVYWEDGGQLVSPHDANIMEEVQKTSVERIQFGRVNDRIQVLDASFDDIYLERIKALSLDPLVVEKNSDLRIVFTPVHGATVRLVPAALAAFGFRNVFTVDKQDIVDGNFPTVASPNPEDPAAFDMALARAREVDAELVMATDPDGDRIGVAVKDPEGEYLLLNGNQCAALVLYYVLEQNKRKGMLTGNEYVVKTIVTSDLLAEMASAYSVDCYDVLTGFKYIAEKIRLLEGEKRFLCGGEESYGFLVGDIVRDKDAVSTACMVAEVAAWAKENGHSLYDLLLTVYREHALYVEQLVSVTRKGREGAEEIRKMMDAFRTAPPASIDGKTVARIIDYSIGVDRDLYMDEEHAVDLPASNVLQFILEDGTRITMRPSGTEPKIKFYFSCRSQMDAVEQYREKSGELADAIDRIKNELGLDKG